MTRPGRCTRASLDRHRAATAAVRRTRLLFEVDRALWQASNEEVIRACRGVQAVLMKEGDAGQEKASANLLSNLRQKSPATSNLSERPRPADPQ